MRNVMEMISRASESNSLVSLATTSAAAGRSPVQNARTCTGSLLFPSIDGFSSAWLFDVRTIHKSEVKKSSHYQIAQAADTH
jgi:hypothetical protein